METDVCCMMKRNRHNAGKHAAITTVELSDHLWVSFTKFKHIVKMSYFVLKDTKLLTRTRMVSVSLISGDGL